MVHTSHIYRPELTCGAACQLCCCPQMLCIGLWIGDGQDQRRKCWALTDKDTLVGSELGNMQPLCENDNNKMYMTHPVQATEQPAATTRKC